MAIFQPTCAPLLSKQALRGRPQRRVLAGGHGKQLHTNIICIYLYIHTHIHPHKPLKEWMPQLEIIEINYKVAFHQDKNKKRGQKLLSCDAYRRIYMNTHALRKQNCLITQHTHTHTHKVLLTSTSREERKMGVHSLTGWVGWSAGLGWGSSPGNSAQMLYAKDSELMCRILTPSFSFIMTNWDPQSGNKYIKER